MIIILKAGNYRDEHLYIGLTLTCVALYDAKVMKIK